MSKVEPDVSKTVASVRQEVHPDRKWGSYISIDRRKGHSPWLLAKLPVPVYYYLRKAHHCKQSKCARCSPQYSNRRGRTRRWLLVCMRIKSSMAKYAVYCVVSHTICKLEIPSPRKTVPIGGLPEYHVPGVPFPRCQFSHVVWEGVEGLI